MNTFLLTFWLGYIFVLLATMQFGSVDGVWKSTRVVGGRLARKDEVPYIVALMVGKKLKCGGSIYNERFIITAAHCLRCAKVKKLRIVANALDLKNLDGTEAQMPVKRVIIHPRFINKPGSGNDIGVIELSQPLVFRKGVASLPLPSQGLESKGKAVLAGYGGAQVRKIDSPRASSTYVLKLTDQLIVPRPECDAAYKKVLKTDLYENPARNRRWGGVEPPKSGMCVTGLDPAGGTGLCQGDSGGPLLCSRKEGDKVEKYLCGVVSAAVGCGLAIPDMYTEVSQFTTWIKNVTGTNL